jgi:flagellar basal-body rod modification protein FlgD
MSIPATEAVAPGGLQSVLPSQTSTTSSSADKDMFLKLLVAQLRYQDPMNPADTSQFLSQSAQFTSLEKMQDVADKTSQVLGADIAFGASGLVGRHVTYTLADGTDGAGTVRGVSFEASGPVLDVDGVTVELGQVQQVTTGTGTSTGTGTTSTGTSGAPRTPTPTSSTPAA